MATTYIVKGGTLFQRTSSGDFPHGRVTEVEVLPSGFTYHIKRRDTYAKVDVKSDDVVIWAPEDKE